MYLPPLQPVINSEIRICGDVEIHPTASIAPGVILQATSNSRIVIGADVCVGMGVIISAYGGVVEIANGATLGSGVLVIGKSQIGSNACIGTATTIFNATVDSMAVIEPGSIVGDTSPSDPQHSRSTIANSDSVSKTIATNNNGYNHPEPPSENLSENSNSVIESTSSNQKSPKEELEKEQITATNTEIKAQNHIAVEKESSDNTEDPWQDKDSASTDSGIEVNMTVKGVEESIKTEDDTAIGKVYIDRLLVTLFPHKKHLNNKSSPDQI